MSRCTGHCCKGFFIPLDALTAPGREWTEDDRKIADLVILLEPRGAEGQWVCTCRYFDGINCLNYEDRPYMCSAYPYGKHCNFAGCTLQPNPPA